MRPIGSHRTLFSVLFCSLMRRALPVIVPLCSLSGSGKGVAGLSFGFLRGQFGAISCYAALLARLSRCLPVWLAPSALSLTLHRGRFRTVVLGYLCFSCAAPHHTASAKSLGKATNMYVCMYVCMYVMYVMLCYVMLCYLMYVCNVCMYACM